MAYENGVENICRESFSGIMKQRGGKEMKW